MTGSKSQVNRWLWLLPTIGGVAVAVGIGLLVWSAAHPVSYGWFAYAPLSDTVFTPQTGFWASRWGIGACGLGALVFAFWVGFLVGRRRAR